MFKVFVLLLLAVAMVNCSDPCSDGTFAHGDYYGSADKCTSEYYWCVNGISLTQNCPGTVWNNDTGGCDHSYNVAACSSDNIDMSEISDCKDADGDLVTTGGYTKPGDCKNGIYYECQNGVEVEKNCAPGTAFNPDTGDCGFITDVADCDKTTTTVPGMATTTIITPSVSVPAGGSSNTTTSTHGSNTTQPGITPSDDPASPTTPLPPLITTQSTTTAQPEPAAGTYVGFVVDDTGSMYNEIEAVKEWIVKCVERKNSSCGSEPTGGWVITSFNDPYTGNVIGPTYDTSLIISEASSYYAHGGGDCPELGFEGLQKVVDVIPEDNSGCKIYFFTDATAKDTYLANTVTKLYQDKGCNFIPILTSCCGPCPSVCDTVDPEYYETHVTDRTEEDTTCSTRIARSVSGSAQTLFYTMSEETGGNIYVTDKPSSPEEMLEFLEEEVTLGFCPTSDIAGPLPDGYKCQEDCTSKGMCWDKSVSKCFCDGTCNHAPISPGYSRCSGEQIVVCEANLATQIIPDLKNCTGYYQCVYGVPHHFNCAKGTVFSTTSASYCDHPENVPPPCGLAGVV